MRAGLAALALLAGVVSGLQIHVPSYGRECIYQEVARGNKLFGSFEVMSGGNLDVDATVSLAVPTLAMHNVPLSQVFGPAGERSWTVEKRPEGHFTVVSTSGGLYKLCFENVAASRADKFVGFVLHTGDEVFQELAQHSHLTPLEQGVTQLADAVQSIMDEQHYFWARERAHRDTSESTNTRVLWFSISETLLIVAVAAWQFWSLRSYIGKSLTF
jgi:p24 family protein beta-1